VTSSLLCLPCLYIIRLLHSFVFLSRGSGHLLAFGEPPSLFVVFAINSVNFTCVFVFAVMHQLGTCAMKPREKGGVVDAKLNVYGVSGLKVADLSIAPANVSANTYGTALVIGEKAAVIIAEELGIKGVV
jgi:choline dehydrogenase-like flavoprotein